MEENLKNKLIYKLEEIKDTLIKEKPKEQGIGLMGGSLGEILFFLHYAKFTGNKSFEDQAVLMLKETLEDISGGIYTFASGFSGLGWLLEYIKKHNFAFIETNDVLEEVDKFVYLRMNQDLIKGNYDYLHGALGAGIYFLNRTNCDLRDQSLNHLIMGLQKLSIEEKDYLKWNFYSMEDQEVEIGRYNLGVSHGIPSILYFFLKSLKSGILHPRTEIILNKCTKFILNQEMDKRKGSFFSNFCNEKPSNDKSRLAWCYGDLGICCILLQIGKHYNDEQILNKVEEIMDYSCSRKDLANNMILDAGLCHGCSGIAHIFNIMYKFFKKRSYLDASEFWYEQTLAFAHFSDGLAGYKSFNPTLAEKYQKNRGFLEGISGIGLSIISFLSKEKLYWDEALLIS